MLEKRLTTGGTSILLRKKRISPVSSPAAAGLEMIVSPEISSISAQTVAGQAVIDKRNADTVVVTPSDRTIVIGGLMFMFGEGGAKRQISGIVFGGGLALFAGQFLTWLF